MVSAQKLVLPPLSMSMKECQDFNLRVVVVAGVCLGLNSYRLVVARAVNVDSDGSFDGPTVSDALDCKKRNGQRLNVLASSSADVDCVAPFGLNEPKVIR